jgi:hypothetical protein
MVEAHFFRIKWVNDPHLSALLMPRSSARFHEQPGTVLQL